MSFYYFAASLTAACAALALVSQPGMLASVACRHASKCWLGQAISVQCPMFLARMFGARPIGHGRSPHIAPGLTGQSQRTPNFELHNEPVQ